MNKHEQSVIASAVELTTSQPSLHCKGGGLPVRALRVPIWMLRVHLKPPGKFLPPLPGLLRCGGHGAIGRMCHASISRVLPDVRQPTALSCHPLHSANANQASFCVVCNHAGQALSVIALLAAAVTAGHRWLRGFGQLPAVQLLAVSLKDVGQLVCVLESRARTLSRSRVNGMQSVPQQHHSIAWACKGAPAFFRAASSAALQVSPRGQLIQGDAIEDGSLKDRSLRGGLHHANDVLKASLVQDVKHARLAAWHTQASANQVWHV
mmetsp:Transcript_5340/g.14355  ORF Transcript_5340/g.14355 Transcript_5340/m.14355 type:complete len:265 (+) Transcript_5340:496-1290(+)